jgi:hypothetical protein
MRAAARSRAIGLALALLAAAVVVSGAQAAEPERFFIDLYGGVARVEDSDVPDWYFADTVGTVGARAGWWIGTDWGVALRTWFFQSDAKQESLTASDLALLGFSVEAMARWRFHDRLAVYGSLGPVLAVATLDVKESPTQPEDDDRSLAPGLSAAVGFEVKLFERLRLFAETQMSLIYAEFEFPNRSITPRLLNFYGLFGVRIPF